MAEIIKDIRSRVSGEEYCKYIHYELQEMSEGRTIPEDQMVINMVELQTILYKNNLEKKDIRLIIANIAHRARLLLARSENKAREKITPKKKG